MTKQVRGIYAALLIPRTATGSLDENSFRRMLEFLAGKGIPRVVLNGATGVVALPVWPSFRGCWPSVRKPSRARANTFAA
ncbi:MAG: hypothetical protein HYZ57_21560 [Acidobacteria bacterium]|nr:hypothetical protein [Acidobacteriota bacterium]